MTEDFKYRAFISYSHRDKPWGDWLHRSLESYRVPKGLVGDQGRDGPIPTRLFPIFRDREELPTSDDLPAQIQHALEQSAYLIVICSPNSASSRWVNAEISEFKRLGRENRILTIIVGGEPNADEKPPLVGADGLTRAECFPAALKFKLGPDGQPSQQRTEPIAADARDDGDGKENAKLKLIAGLLGVGFDALRQRALEEQRRREKISRLTLMILAGLALLLFLTSVAILMPIAKEYLHTRLIPRFPTAVLAMFLLFVSAYTLVVGVQVGSILYLRRPLSVFGGIALPLILAGVILLRSTAIGYSQTGLIVDLPLALLGMISSVAAILMLGSAVLVSAMRQLTRSD